MTVNEYLNILEDNDMPIYNLTFNMQILTYALGRQLRCNSNELKSLYSVSSLYYLNEYNFDDINSEDIKLIKKTKTFLNSKNINFLKQKMELIIFICSCYNDLRKEKVDHNETMNIILNHERIPVIVKNAFKEIINKDNLYKDLLF